jgi:hypothetical protein
MARSALQRNHVESLPDAGDSNHGFGQIRIRLDLVRCIQHGLPAALRQNTCVLTRPNLGSALVLGLGDDFGVFVEAVRAGCRVDAAAAVSRRHSDGPQERLEHAKENLANDKQAI